MTAQLTRIQDLPVEGLPGCDSIIRPASGIFLVVGAGGGLATSQATAAQGVPFRFPNRRGFFFTDASSAYELRYRFY